MALDFTNLDAAIAQHFDQRIDDLQEQLRETVPDELKLSQTAPVYSDGGKHVTITWTDPEALLLHEGYTSRSGKVFPPERWVETAMDRLSNG
jgi:hypothetical protein